LSKGPEFEPKILAFLCNWCPSAFFFGAKFSAVTLFRKSVNGKRVALPHAILRIASNKLALTCSNFAFDGRWLIA
jgi:hypothetical protein